MAETSLAVREAFWSQDRKWAQKFGMHASVAFAIGWMACMAGPIGAIEIAPIVLGVVWVVRWHAVGPATLPLFRTGLVQMVLLLAAWGALSLLWTTDKGKGIQEFGNARWLWCIFPVWLAMHRRAWLIAGLVAGVAMGQLTQVFEWIGLKYGMAWLVWPHPPSDVAVARVSGWWHHPVMAGVILVGALGLHLPPAVFGSGWRRIAGITGSLASVAGMIATGSRGAWLGGALLIVMTLVLAAWRLRGRMRRVVLIGACVLAVIGGSVTWMVGREIISVRFESAVREVRGAMERGDYSSDTGARIRFAMWAVEMIREKPFAGHGVGSYETWIRKKEGEAAGTKRIAPQAHNTVLHAWATMGIPGAALMIALTATAIAGGLRAAREIHKQEGDMSSDWMGTYVAGPPWAMMGIALMSGVETIHVNIQPAAFTSALLCLCIPLVPGKSRPLV